MPQDATAIDNAAPSSAESKQIPELADLKPTELETWRKTGTLPAPPQPADPAAADTSKETPSEGAKPKSAPATEPGKGQGNGRRRKESAEDRIGELIGQGKAKDTEIARLRAELDTAKKMTTAEPSTAKPVEPPKEPVRPKMQDFEGKPWNEYEAAIDKYNAEKVQYEIDKALASDRQARAQAESNRQLSALLEDAKKLHPDFEHDKITNALFAGNEVPEGVRQRIAMSPVLGHLLYFIGENDANLQDFVKAAKSNPWSAIDKIYALEAVIAEELKKPVGAKDSQPKPKPSAEPTPPARVIAPTAQVGGRESSAENPVDAAVRAGGGDSLTPEVKAAFARSYRERR